MSWQVELVMGTWIQILGFIISQIYDGQGHKPLAMLPLVKRQVLCVGDGLMGYLKGKDTCTRMPISYASLNLWESPVSLTIFSLLYSWLVASFGEFFSVCGFGSITPLDLADSNEIRTALIAAGATPKVVKQTICRTNAAVKSTATATSAAPNVKAAGVAAAAGSGAKSAGKKPLPVAGATGSAGSLRGAHGGTGAAASKGTCKEATAQREAKVQSSSVNASSTVVHSVQKQAHITTQQQQPRARQSKNETWHLLEVPLGF